MMPAYAKRRRKLRQWLERNEVDAFVVSSPANVRYLSGFTGEGLLVIGDWAGLSTDRRYELEALKLSGRWRLCLHRDGHLAGVIELLKQCGGKRIAFEAEAITYAGYERLSEAGDGWVLRPTRKVVEQWRRVKDPSELEAIRRAARITDAALERTIARLEPGRSEKEVALDLEREALTCGGEKMGFETIVAFGPSAAYPHARPSERRLEHGHMVKIDCGVQVGGYHSDVTRTVCPWPTDDTYHQVYAAVYEAQEAALAAIKAGVKAADLDAVAREVLTERGYGAAFSHGLGHGVGLEIHEAPTLSARSEDTLRAGMVVTIEPGVYIEGWGGIRIEDTVVVTREGCEVLTHAAKEEPRSLGTGL